MSLALLADAPCGDCGALLDEGQRYCVHCGRRRSEVEDPALAWLAAQRERGGAVAATTRTAATPPARNPLALPALSLLLLPVAVAIGALVGHHGDSGKQQQQLLAALRSQKAPVVNVGNVAAGTASTGLTGGKAAKAKTAKAKAASKDSTGGKVVARTKYGVAHQVEGFKPTAQKVAADKKLVENINRTIGKNYLQAQKNLPDTIVVPTGTSGGNSPGAQGRGD